MKTGSKFSIKQSQYFDAISEEHGQSALLKENRALRLEFEALQRSMGKLTGKRVLDIGCGGGRHALRLARFAEEVVGVDISKKSIDLANQTAQKLGVKNFRGVVGDYHSPVENAAFDVAIMVNVFHHIDDIETVLESIARSLKDDGKLIIFEFNPLNILFVPFLVVHGQVKAHFNAQYLRSNIVSLKKYLTRSGWRPMCIEKYALLPTILYNYSRFFERLNSILNSIPGVRALAAFHIVTCQKSTHSSY